MVVLQGLMFCAPVHHSLIVMNRAVIRQCRRCQHTTFTRPTPATPTKPPQTLILIIGITTNVTLFVVFVQHHTQPLPDPHNNHQQQRPDGRHRFMIYGASACGLTRFDTFLHKAHARPPPPPLRKRRGHTTSKLNYLRLLREAAKHQPGVRTHPKKHTLALTPRAPPLKGVLLP